MQNCSKQDVVNGRRKLAEVYQVHEEMLMSSKGRSLSDQPRRHKLGNYVEGRHDFG